LIGLGCLSTMALVIAIGILTVCTGVGFMQQFSVRCKMILKFKEHIVTVHYLVGFSTDRPVNTLELHKIIAKSLPCFSLSESLGSWEGDVEESYTVSFIGTLADKIVVYELAKELKTTYSQEAVLVVETPCSSHFV
jgi:hypothetical protein